MPDDKRGREEQAAHQERRQRERELAEARERGDEAEPEEETPGYQLGALDVALERHEFPTTPSELIDAYGDYEIETQGGVETVEAVLAPIDSESYATPDEVRRRLLDLIGR